MSSLLQKFKKKKSSESPDSSGSNNSNSNKRRKFGSKSNQKNSNNSDNASSSGSSEVRGILKNKKDAEKYHNTDSYPTSDDLDESLRNARKNMTINLKVTKNKNSTNTDETPSNILNETDEPLPSNAKEVASDETLTSNDNINDNNNNNNNNSDTNNNTNDNTIANTESKTDGNDQDTDIEMKDSQGKKDVYWDEDNLRQNEEEKVPRMKIDEAPTPYHEMPDELLDDNPPDQNINDQLLGGDEEILDIDPMDMLDTGSVDAGDDASSQHKSGDSVNLNDNDNNAPTTSKTLQQERQAALLQDTEYRDKMINDALKRREDDIENNSGQKDKKKKKIIRAAWEDDNDESMQNSDIGSSDVSDVSEKKKQDFKKKRSAHYNEFYAVKAMKAKMNQDIYDED